MQVKFAIKHNNIPSQLTFLGYGESIEEAMCEGLRNYLHQIEGTLELGEIVTVQSVEIEK